MHQVAKVLVLVIKNPPVNAGDIKRLGFSPWLGKIPWRRRWHPTPGFVPGKFHGQRAWLAIVHVVRRIGQD